MGLGVAAVIPSFRPNSDQLVHLVQELRTQSVPVLVADDGSPCTFDRSLDAASSAGASVSRHRRNAGIARSLNEGLLFAQQLSARWLLTLDQDSEVEPTYIGSLLHSYALASNRIGAERIGALASGAIDDASGTLGYPLRMVDDVATTDEVIQTGTLWSVDALAGCGGFDERLGIDAVDAAACLSLRRADHVIVVAPDARITHRIGAGKQVRILGRDVLASGHSPERRTTITRNRLRLFPAEFAQSPTHALRTLRRLAVQTSLAVTVEDDRWAKAKGAARGLLPRSTR